jgi:general secretion pathway protein D
VVSANRDANTVTVFLNQSTVVAAANAVQQAYPAVQYEDLGVKARATPRLHANGEVTLKLQFELRSFANSNFNGIPVITNRTVEQMVRLKEDEPAVLAGILQQDIEQTASGWPGAVTVPGPGQTASKRQGLRRETELIIVITPRRIRLAPRKDRTIYAVGKDTSTPTGGAPERPPQ